MDFLLTVSKISLNLYTFPLLKTLFVSALFLFELKDICNVLLFFLPLSLNCLQIYLIQFFYFILVIIQEKDKSTIKSGFQKKS